MASRMQQLSRRCEDGHRIKLFWQWKSGKSIGARSYNECNQNPYKEQHPTHTKHNSGITSPVHLILNVSRYDPLSSAAVPYVNIAPEICRMTT